METLSEFMEKWELMDPDQPVHQMVKATGLPIVTSAIQSLAADFDKFMKKTSKDIENFFESLKETARKSREYRIQKQMEQKAYIEDTQFEIYDWLGDHDGDGSNAWTTPAFNSPTNIWDVTYGIINGAIDVFPYESNPNRCRDNITQAWSAGENWANW